MKIADLIRLFLMLVLTASVLQIYPQCIVADSVTPVCQGSSAILNAYLQPGCMNGTDSYSFEQFTFNPYPLVKDTAVDPEFRNNAGQLSGNHDDTWAGPYPIGFDFCFLNSVFSQYWIGSNGWITFSNPLNQGWTIFTPFTIPTTNAVVPKNAIFAPYQDWNPTIGAGGPNRSKVFRHIISDPPSNSKLVVYWDSCALYSCATALGTFQIVLNQSDYSVENNITNKPSCSWQTNAATQGVHNSNGTIAFIAFSRNATSWTTSNESTRFVPNGITWYKDSITGAIAGYGPTITVSPLYTTKYYAVIATCTGDIQSTWVVVHVKPLPTLNGPATACFNSIQKYTTEPAMTNYIWTFTGGIPAGGGTSTSDSILMQWNTFAGPHNVSIKYTDPVSGCSSIIAVVKPVSLIALPVPTITSGITPVCPGDTGNLYTTQAGKLNYVWTPSAGGVITYGGGTGDNFAHITWNNPGASQVGVIYTDPATLCTAGSPGTFNVTVKTLPDVIFTPSHVSGKWCSQDSVKVFLSSGAPGANFTWSSSANPLTVIPSSITNRSGNILQPFQNTGFNMEAVNFEAKAMANGCTSSPYPYSVQIYPVPDVSATPPSQFICSGGSTQTVSLTSNVSGTGYNWSYPCTGFITPCPGNGTGSTIPAFTLANSSTTLAKPLTFIITANIDNCPGTGTTHIVTVNPRPTVTNSTMSQGVCLGTPTQLVSLTCSVNPALYQWTASPSHPSITGYPAGIQTTSFIPVHTLLDPTNTAGFVTYAIIPHFTMNQLTCYGDVSNYAINTWVLPVVTITGPTPALACEGQSNSFSVPADPGTSFTWSLVPPSIGTLTSIQGLPTSTFLWNASGNNILAKTIGLTVNGCSATGSASFLIRPKPTVSLNHCIDPVTTPEARPYVLKGGTPLGATGMYSGTGVSLVSGHYEFNPASVPLPLPKTITISYTYNNMYGCPGTDAIQVQVISPPPFQCGNIMEPLQDVRTTPHRNYSTYQKGGNCWMTVNLDYGTSTLFTQAQTDNCIPEKYCAPGDAGCTSYGGFYSWDELMQYQGAEGAQGLCPPGWHIPTKTEWQALIDDPANQGNGLAGGYLKDVQFWAFTGGMLYMNSTWAFVPPASLTGAMFWTSTMNGTLRAIARGMNLPATSTSFYSSSRANSFNVRCVKD